MNRKLLILSSLVFLHVGILIGQDDHILINIESWAGYTSNGQVPFWLRSNRYGSIPINGSSVSFIGSVRKDYDLSKGKLFDWGASIEGRANLGQGSNLTLIEGYGKVRLSIFELRAGRSKKITGFCDTTLTSGSWAISGTNLGIPEIELSVRDFWTLPWFGRLFAFKGNFAHGWLGDVQMSRYIMQDTLTLVAYLHQKSLYGRFGKPEWRLKLYGGFNHQVVWGHEQEYYLDDYTLTPLETYYYVLTGKKFSNGYIQEERQGNHLGSIDLGLEYTLKKVRILIYRQNLYEGGGLAHLANIQDGLNGLSIQNLQDQNNPCIWRNLLIEFLYTKNQAGMAWSPEYGSQYEPYYNHGQYITGWSYLDSGLGTAFINTRDFIRKNLATDPEDFYVNNRVMIFHLGFEGSIKSIDYLLKASFSENYGTYHTTDEEQSTGIQDPGIYGIFGEQKQFSIFLNLNREFNSGWKFGLIGAGDIGQLYYNSFGLFFRTSYSINLQ